MSVFSAKCWPLRRCTDPFNFVRCSSIVIWSQSTREPQQRSSSTTTVPPKDIDDHSHPFFNYTSGRWLYNETLRLIERRRYFSVDALCTVAAKAVGRSSNEIAALIKLAEGGSYRVFVVNFHGHPSIVVRLPYPSAVPRSYGLASEVATMMYLRSQGLPVPRIYDWSSSAANEIGSEYMIMEKCPGQELHNVWYSMEPPERKAIVEKIVQFESKLFALDLPAYGSIYLKGFLDASVKTIDLPAQHGQPETKDFCIGPSTERLWWYCMRDELNVHRGPWCSSEELLTAVASRESLWLKRFGKPRLPREAAYRSILKHKLANPLDQIHNLQDYYKIVKQLVPADNSLSKPTLRHPDMSPNNIFISDSGDIASVIDWEHSVALPQFLQAKMPSHFQNFGDEDSEAFKPPQPPEGFDSMPEDKKFLAADLYRRRQLHYYYLGFMHRDNRIFFQAVLRTDIVARNRLIEAAGRPWEGDSVSLKAELIRTVDQWSNLVSVTGAKSECPIKYEQAEIDQCLALDARQQEVDEQMQQVRDHLGINIDGWVQHDLYEEAKIKAQNLKAEMLDSVDTDDERRDIIENWPYQDHEEID